MHGEEKREKENVGDCGDSQQCETEALISLQPSQMSKYRGTGPK